MSSVEDRAAGALMGAFIGEALGVGPHWYDGGIEDLASGARLRRGTPRCGGLLLAGWLGCSRCYARAATG